MSHLLYTKDLCTMLDLTLSHLCMFLDLQDLLPLWSLCVWLFQGLFVTWSISTTDWSSWLFDCCQLSGLFDLCLLNTSVDTLLQLLQLVTSRWSCQELVELNLFLDPYQHGREDDSLLDDAWRRARWHVFWTWQNWVKPGSNLEFCDRMLIA